MSAVNYLGNNYQNVSGVSVYFAKIFSSFQVSTLTSGLAPLRSNQRDAAGELGGHQV